jgi:two-component system nitrogen regulation sensor histidine kinase GlnL
LNDMAPPRTPLPDFAGLDLLATAVIVLDESLRIRFMNTAAESLFEASRRNFEYQPLKTLLPDAGPLADTSQEALRNDLGFIEHEWDISRRHHPPLTVNCTGTPFHLPERGILLEFRPLNQMLRIAREEKIQEDQKINRELIRNLAHEIRNPLGGIRGAAQLLERELDRPALKEYTQVIRAETDRLQLLMDRMLSPSRPQQKVPVNIHEVLERVRSLILAEYPEGIIVRRDYDTSLPEIVGDREQLIQAVLNIVRNAAQALQGRGEILLQSRAVRQITLARRRFRLGLLIRIVDNGPGIPQELQNRIFQPLVTGREGGSGLGLMLAQNLISQHHGMVEFESSPGHTCFSLIIPVPESEYVSR